MRGSCALGFAALLAAAEGRGLALIGKALRQRARNAVGRVLVVAVIALALAGQQHVPGMVIVVVPLRAIEPPDFGVG